MNFMLLHNQRVPRLIIDEKNFIENMNSWNFAFTGFQDFSCILYTRGMLQYDNARQFFFHLNLPTFGEIGISEQSLTHKSSVCL